MEKFLQQQYRLLVVESLVKTAQAVEKQQSSTNTSIDAKKIVENIQLQEKIDELLLSPEIYRTLEDKFKVVASSAVEKFIEVNKEKISEYTNNPDLLMKDIEEQLPLIKYLNWLDTALDVALIASSIVSLVSVVFTSGAASPAAISLETAKWSARALMKKFIKKEGLQLLKKLFSREILKRIATSVATKGAVTFTKNFLEQTMRQIAIIFTIDALLSILKEVSLNAFKDIIAAKGAEKLGLPESVISDLLGVKSDAQAAEQILINFKSSVEKDLKNLFTTQKGLAHLAFDAAILSVLDRYKINSKILRRNILFDLHHFLKDESIKGSAKKWVEQQEQILQLTKEQIPTTDILKRLTKDSKQPFTEDQFEQILKKHGIPSFLFPAYLKALVGKIKTQQSITSDVEIKKLTEDLAIKASLDIFNMQDNIRELAVIEFIKQYKDRLQKNPSALRSLLKDVSDIETTSPEQLLLQTKTSSLDELLDLMTRQKKYLINIFAEKLAIFPSSEVLDKIKQWLTKQANLQSYKTNLYNSIFTE